MCLDWAFQSWLSMMLVCIWFGFYWVFSSFFDLLDARTFKRSKTEENTSWMPAPWIAANRPALLPGGQKKATEDSMRGVTVTWLPASIARSYSYLHPIVGMAWCELN